MEKDNSQFAPLFGGIEAGGTKFNCVIGSGTGEIIDGACFSTSSPEKTLAQVGAFFHAGIKKYGVLKALGIASFGPIDLDKTSETFGCIIHTPKLEWASTNIVGYFKSILNIPVCIDTDVNGSAMGELLFGAGKEVSNFVYVTVGTGIGAGVINQGKLLHGRSHPEAGHILIPHDKTSDAFGGCCPFHKNCLEGLASGQAIASRWGQAAEELEAGHPAWDLQAHYLALACVNFTQCYCPEKIILGGGVMGQVHLFPMIREKFTHQMAGYMSSWLEYNLDNYIVPPTLCSLSAQKGALALAQSMLKG